MHVYIALLVIIVVLKTSLSFHFALFPLAKHRSDNCASSSSSSVKHRRTEIDPKWATDFLCVEVSDEREMLCLLCRKHNRQPKKVSVSKAIWIDPPCKNLTQQSLVSHGQSQSRTLAMRMKANLASSRKDGGIAMTLDKVISAERKAFIGAHKCMNNHIYSTLFKIKERKSDRRSK